MADKGLNLFDECVPESHSVKVGPALRDPEPRDPGTRDPGPPSKFKVGPGTLLKFKSRIPGPPSKFKSGTTGPPTNFKSGTFIITFVHCYIYNMEITFHE